MAKSKKPKAPRVVYNHPEELYKFFTGNKEKIVKHVINSIRFAIDNKLSDIDVFELRYSMDGQNIIILNMKKEEWQPALETMVNELTDMENYEDCVPLRSMIDEINIM